MNKVKKIMVFITSFLIINALSFGISYGSANNELEYGVSSGDDINYHLNLDFDISFDNLSVFTELKDYINETMNKSVNVNELYYDLMNETSLDLFFTLSIENISSNECMKNYSTYYETFNNDIINASFSFENTNGVATSLNNSINGKLKSLFDLFRSYNLIDINSTYSPISIPDLNNVTLLNISYGNHYYDYNGTLYESQPDRYSSLNISTLSGVPFILPMNFNLSEAQDIIFDEMISPYFNNTSLENSSIEEIFSNLGINETYISEDRLSMYFNSSNINNTLFSSFDDLKDSLKNNLNVSLNDANSYVAIIYDKNMTLESFAFYQDIKASLNLTALTNGSINVSDWEFTINFTFTITQDGSDTPSKSDIQNGEIYEKEDTPILDEKLKKIFMAAVISTIVVFLVITVGYLINKNINKS